MHNFEISNTNEYCTDIIGPLTEKKPICYSAVMCCSQTMYDCSHVFTYTNHWYDCHGNFGLLWFPWTVFLPEWSDYIACIFNGFKKQEMGAQIWNYFRFSPVKTGLKVHSQKFTHPPTNIWFNVP